MGLRHYFQILTSWLWLLISSTVLTAAISFGASTRMAPVYETSTLILVAQAAGSQFIEYTSLLTSAQLAKTYSKLLVTRPILQQVITNLDIDDTPSSLEGDVSVRVIPDTQLLELSVENRDPALAVRIANEITHVFLQQESQRQEKELASYGQVVVEQMSSVENDIASAEARLAELELTAQGSDTPGREEEMQALRTQIRDGQTLYSSLLSTYVQIEMADARRIDVQVVEPALPPAVLTSPRKTFNTAVGAAGGLALAIGMIVLLDFVDNTLKTTEQVEQILALPALSTIPRFSGSGHSPAEGPLAQSHATSMAAEAYRVLRTSVQFADVDRTTRTLLVTSPRAGEGKTTTASNLGVVMAQAGKRVVLVDSDLRKPSLHRVFGLGNEIGLTNLLLADETELDDYLQPTSVANLRVLTSGPHPPNPSELLGSERCRTLIGRLLEYVDVAIFDSSPVLAVTDPAVLAPIMDGIILVAETGRTRREDMLQAKEAVSGVGGRILGVVLAKAKSGGTQYYYPDDASDRSRPGEPTRPLQVFARMRRLGGRSRRATKTARDSESPAEKATGAPPRRGLSGLSQWLRSRVRRSGPRQRPSEKERDATENGTAWEQEALFLQRASAESGSEETPSGAGSSEGPLATTGLETQMAESGPSKAVADE